MALQKVACHLVAKGLQPLPDIMRGTQMPPGQVKQALLLLLQHNYAVAYLHKEDEGIKNARPPYHLYAPCLDRMLQIIRYECPYTPWERYIHAQPEVGRVT